MDALHFHGIHRKATLNLQSVVRQEETDTGQNLLAHPSISFVPILQYRQKDAEISVTENARVKLSAEHQQGH